MAEKTKYKNWLALAGWGTAILLLCGLVWMFNRINNLDNSPQVTTENLDLKEGKTAEHEIEKNNKILEILRTREYQSFTLPGNQAVAPEAFVIVHLNKNEKIVFIDVKELPAAPRGMVYQVWSMKMEPYAFASMGLIEEKNEAAVGIYKFVVFPHPETVGITLEAEGGSETPNLSRLYILGTIANRLGN